MFDKRLIWLLGLIMTCAGCATPALWGAKDHQATAVPNFYLSQNTGNILVRYQESTFGMANTNAETVTNRAYWLNLTNTAGRPSFVDVTNGSDWIAVPLITLDRLPVTNREDAAWLFAHNKKSHGQETNRTAHRVICVGTNGAGRAQFVTDVRPEKQFFCRLATPSPRYMVSSQISPEHGYAVVCYDKSLFLWRDGREMGSIQLPSYRTYGRANPVRVLLTPLAATVDAACFTIVVSQGNVLLIAGSALK